MIEDKITSRQVYSSDSRLGQETIDAIDRSVLRGCSIGLVEEAIRRGVIRVERSNQEGRRPGEILREMRLTMFADRDELVKALEGERRMSDWLRAKLAAAELALDRLVSSVAEFNTATSRANSLLKELKGG